MKLLFDQNLAAIWWHASSASFRPPSTSRAQASIRASDQDVWDHARANGFTIVSRDSDFNQLSFLHGPPPRIVWLRIGNCTTDKMEQILRGRSADILAFESDLVASVLVIER